MQIWTIGHSNHPLDVFWELLRAHSIALLADVRSHPGSRKNPHFNADSLRTSLVDAGVRYHALPELGGRRKTRPDSRNVAWQSASFRGYADYMETPAFRAGIERLLQIAAEGRTAFMCAEAVWWRCHRALIADYLKAQGHDVWHILSATKIQAHPYTSAAQIIDGELRYTGLHSGQESPGD